MSAELSEKAHELLEAPNFCHLATVMPDGTPQVTPVWVDVEDNVILVNTAEGRVKVENLRRDPKVGLSIANQENPYESLSVRGKVIEDTQEGADEHIDKLAMKYLGEEEYPFRASGEVRVIFKIEPENVYMYGS